MTVDLVARFIVGVVMFVIVVLLTAEFHRWRDRRRGPLGRGHEYLSTACFHKQCESCRKTCKFCPAECLHSCHRKEK